LRINLSPYDGDASHLCDRAYFPTSKSELDDLGTEADLRPVLLLDEDEDVDLAVGDEPADPEVMLSH
jgi:hypothetical protein